MQSAFRAQNAYQFEDENGQLKRKENAYIFDFAPERTLILFDEFANNLKTKTSNGSGTSEERKKNIATLLNFLPVIGEDSDGKMMELDAEKVLTIPHQLKAMEVVKHGFMSNFLFANISGIFQAPQIVLDTINQLDKAKEEKNRRKELVLPNISIDENGEVQADNEIVINKTNALFTEEKVYQVEEVLENSLLNVQEQPTEHFIKKMAKEVARTITPTLDELKPQFETPRAADIKRMNATVERKIFDKTKEQVLAFDRRRAEVSLTFDKKKEEAVTEASKAEILEEQEEVLTKLLDDFKTTTLTAVKEEVKIAQKEAVREQETRQEERKKSSVEDNVREHLRGFSRTIPSFIMAYGDENLTLGNFDEYTPADVFQEVTGITLAEFCFLRDGGDYLDEKTGELQQFDGHLFDEIVFNQSIQEFLALKEKLADYFIETQEEDIFDYIPPQKTNQIFTPKPIVKMMVDKLDEENPGIFDDSKKTFIDLYVKSGLYMTEITKKLFHSETIKKEFPNEQERIKHILENQVFGCAPSEIIQKIAQNFVYGSYENIRKDNLKMVDLTPYAKDGKVGEKLAEVFGAMGGQ